MKYKMLLISALLVFMLVLSACGPAERNENEGATSTPLGGATGLESPTVEMTAETTSEATTAVETTPLSTSTEMAPSTTETAIVPVTGGETLLGVSQSDTMGAYLVDKNGMTVYMYKSDTQNGSSSTCTGDCANTWLPVTMAGSLGQGTPGAGSTSMPGTPGTGLDTSTPSAGGSGTGLSTSTPSTGGGSAGGLSTSTPSTGTGGTGLGTAVAGTAMPGTGIDPTLIGSITRDDGTIQLTYNGWPLYTYAQDVAPGDTNGQGKGDNWYMISPSGDPIEK